MGGNVSPVIARGKNDARFMCGGMGETRDSVNERA